MRLLDAPVSSYVKGSPSRASHVADKLTKEYETEPIPFDLLRQSMWTANTPGVFPATIAALATQNRVEEATTLLQWIATQRGPFEDQTPQCAREGLLGLFALSQNLGEVLPEGTWEAPLKRAWNGFVPDPQRPVDLNPFHALMGELGPCGDWLRTATGQGIFALFEGGDLPSESGINSADTAIALLGTLLPVFQTHPEIFKTLKAQVDASLWQKYLIRSQLILNRPTPGLSSNLTDLNAQTPLPTDWQYADFLARVGADPTKGPMDLIASDLLEGEGPWPLFSSLSTISPAKSLQKAVFDVLQQPKHPRGAIALRLLQAWKQPIPDVKNHRAQLLLGQESALVPLLNELTLGHTVDTPSLRQLSDLLGEVGAEIPAIGRRLIQAVDAQEKGLSAIDCLAENLWWHKHLSDGLSQEQQMMGQELLRWAQRAITKGGETALRAGRILGFVSEGKGQDHKNILNTMARAPGYLKHWLLEPLGACERADNETLNTLCSALESQSDELRLGGLLGLGRMAKTQEGALILKGNWLFIRKTMGKISAKSTHGLGSHWTRELWRLSRPL